MGLIKIWKFNIDYASLILFFIGLFIGILLFGLVFLIIKLKARKYSDFIIKSNENVTADDANKLIISSVEALERSIENKEDHIVELTKNIAYNLMEDIARLFFPSSKRPLFELSLDELITLAETVSINIEKALDQKLFSRILKGVKISTLVSVSVGREYYESEAFEIKKQQSIKTKIKSFVGDVIKKTKATVIKTGISALQVLPKTCRLIVQVCGEETYKAFAIKLSKDPTIDSGIDEIVIEE